MTTEGHGFSVQGAATAASVAPLNDVLVKAFNAQLDFAQKALKASVEAGIQIDNLGTIIDLMV